MKLEVPQFEEIKKGIDELLLIEKWDNYKIIKHPKSFYKKVNELFLKKIGFLPIIIDPQNSDSFPFKFYRIRKESKDFNSSLISEYSHPPASVNNYFQRANIPKHPVFYCSDEPFTAIAEVIKYATIVDPNDTYYLSEWAILPNTPIKFSPFLFGNLKENSSYNLWSESNFHRLKITLEKSGNIEDYESFEKILRFLSTLFVSENTYVVSSYIAHHYLYASHSMRSDIFVFPSVQLDKSNVNYAIHPNFVSEKMRLKKVFKMSFEELNKGTSIKYGITNFGLNRDSIIFWNGNLKENLKEIRETFPDFIL